jgi:pilus assembly protein CpaE
METVIACNDASVSAKISAALRQAGIECPLSHSVSLESSVAAVGRVVGDSSLVVFFGSQQFSAEDLSQLKSLSAGSGPHVKIVAVGPANSPHVILEAVHSGAADFLDINNNFEGELRKLVERLKSSAGQRTQVGRLFTVIGPAGGSGTSVLATNLAAALAQMEQVCGLLDFKVRGGDLATLLKSQPRHTLLSLAGKAHQLDRAIFDQSLIKHDCGIHLLASPQQFSDYRQINPHLIQQVLDFARASYPNVVVDLEDMEHPEQVRTLAASDRIIVPLRLDFVALNRAKKCVEHLLRANVRRECITLVANRVGQPKELPVESFAEVLGLPIDHQIPDDPSAVNAAVNLGMPLVTSSPKSKATASIIRLAESLTGASQNVGEAQRSKWRPLSLKAAASIFGLVSA